MSKPTLTIHKTQAEIKEQLIKAKIAEHASKKAKGEKATLDSLAEKLDLIIDMLSKD
ncbi:hypothetical protein [Heliophilum fasciatum]|uniref:Uncharacterized protein n=1 Tax=Heliophilum fasciatum TaxID=35700 RepID=A0A4R2RHP0_9FIRM|nr:hypothetical protein [Heliophilum fasciatum]MCW2278748.1 hypothetical protein [Heliophilum fasciatum]TCP62513.1 hypothetical protein EDD73_12111 [Heliophilum fasciatum]